VPYLYNYTNYTFIYISDMLLNHSCFS